MRKGRSTFRRGTRHADRWDEIQRLQRIVDAGTRVAKRGRVHIEAEESLGRKGFHALKRCRLMQRCPRSLLTVPGRVFGGLTESETYVNCKSVFMCDIDPVNELELNERNEMYKQIFLTEEEVCNIQNKLSSFLSCVM